MTSLLNIKTILIESYVLETIDALFEKFQFNADCRRKNDAASIQELFVFSQLILFLQLIRSIILFIIWVVSSA